MSDIDDIGRRVAEANATARHARLVEETTRLQRREQARDRLLIAMADATQLTLRMVNLLSPHSDSFEPVTTNLRNAKIIFAGTLDKL